LRNFTKHLISLIITIFICALGIYADEILINLKGDYLAYSYDFNHVFGRSVTFKFGEYTVSSYNLKFDITSRAFIAYGSVILEKGDLILRGDEFIFDPENTKGALVKYEENVAIQLIGVSDAESLMAKRAILDKVTLSEIQKSFIYCTGQEIEITKEYEVVGYKVTFYVEGLASLSFKKFKLSDGIQQRKGFSFNKIWYTKTQGIIAQASYLFDKKNKANSLSRIHYEERSVLKNHVGPDRQVDIMSSTSLNLSETTNLSLTGNYNSSGSWNTDLWLNKKWSEKLNTNFNLSYNKPINYKGEVWLGIQSRIDTGKLGSFSFLGKYEVQNQFIGSLSYGIAFLKNIGLLFNSSYSKIKISGSEEYSEILSGGLNLSYNSRLFNLATNYFLNYDLLGSQLLSQPQLLVGLNPIPFYDGLLSVRLSNILIYNKLIRDETNEYTYSNNTVLSLSSQSIYFNKSTNLNFSIAFEQFFEKEKRNFTSVGFIVSSRKEFLKGIALEGHYSIQSRRKTKNWLIEGTTSQDLSMTSRANPNDWLNSWVSISYDPKNRQFRQSFADLSIMFLRKWQFHSLLNYDFLLKKLTNIDLYLIREAGRFQFRFVWRSLSKQFLIELIPR
jgi:hypothetical protein